MTFMVSASWLGSGDSTDIAQAATQPHGITPTPHAWAMVWSPWPGLCAGCMHLCPASST